MLACHHNVISEHVNHYISGLLSFADLQSAEKITITQQSLYTFLAQGQSQG